MASVSEILPQVSILQFVIKMCQFCLKPLPFKPLIMIDKQQQLSQGMILWVLN